MHAPLTFVPRQRELFGESAPLAALTTPEVDAAIAAHAPCFIGVSGGCDSQALAHRTVEHLDAAGHRGPRYLIHADLGRVEWRESLPVCERTAQRLGIALIVVRRRAGGLMERWQSRWEANCERYYRHIRQQFSHGTRSELSTRSVDNRCGQPEKSLSPPRVARKIKSEANDNPSSRSPIDNVIIGCASSRLSEETQYGEEISDHP